jgi:hypothetical protein
MSIQYTVLLIIVALTVAVLVAVTFWRPRTIKEYWQRSCMGRAWTRTFPQASPDEIRQFLYMFVDAFAFPRRRALLFAPTDRVFAIYSALYPLKGFPDALELETLALRLEGRYRLDLRKIWRENLTLGEIFSRIASPLA